MGCNTMGVAAGLALFLLVLLVVVAEAEGDAEAREDEVVDARGRAPAAADLGSRGLRSKSKRMASPVGARRPRRATFKKE